MQGYCGRFAIVDLTHRHVDYSTVPDSVLQSLIGGRGLGAAILYRHGRAVEPLAPESPLCMLVGPMTATDFPIRVDNPNSDRGDKSAIVGPQ